MGCLRIAKQIEQGLGCYEHLGHDDFAVLISNLGGQLTCSGGVARDIRTVGEPQDGIGRLAT